MMNSKTKNNSELNRRAVYGLVTVAGGLVVAILFLISDGKSPARNTDTSAFALARSAPVLVPNLIAANDAFPPAISAKPQARMKPINASAKPEEAWPTVALGAARNDSADSVSVERAVLITEGLDEGKLGLVMN